ncbi:MAG: hypothetical protein QGG54_21360, partial [Gammaproteobacteria bacterium]|nr:hypothetical protein [Gammaproteobacteria bacterium]
GFDSPRERHLLNDLRPGTLERSPKYKDANALYAFKSRGFGGETGVVAEHGPAMRESKRQS